MAIMYLHVSPGISGAWSAFTTVKSVENVEDEIRQLYKLQNLLNQEGRPHDNP